MRARHWGAVLAGLVSACDADPAPPASGFPAPPVMSAVPTDSTVPTDSAVAPDSLPSPPDSTARDTLTRPVASLHARRDSSRSQDRYDDHFRRYSKRYFGIAYDWRWFKAQAIAESRLDSAALSPAGARGVMQLMPSTFGFIQSRLPEFRSIDDPEWNIAAGIMHDRHLYKLWEKRITPEERHRFMFGSYNAGEGTIARAATAARAASAPDALRWAHVEEVAPRVTRWRYRETLTYVRRIDTYHQELRRGR